MSLSVIISRFATLTMINREKLIKELEFFAAKIKFQFELFMRQRAVFFYIKQEKHNGQVLLDRS